MYLFEEQQTCLVETLVTLAELATLHQSIHEDFLHRSEVACSPPAHRLPAWNPIIVQSCLREQNKIGKKLSSKRETPKGGNHLAI